jgi:autonomous glycyl radical cofactor GrcA
MLHHQREEMTERTEVVVEIAPEEKSEMTEKVSMIALKEESEEEAVVKPSRDLPLSK